MILNNLFYITVKFADTHPRCIEELWGTLCQYWPNNLKVTLRYLVIISGMAPAELLIYVSFSILSTAHCCNHFQFNSLSRPNAWPSTWLEPALED